MCLVFLLLHVLLYFFYTHGKCNVESTDVLSTVCAC